MVPPLPHLVWRRIINFLSDDLTTLLNISALHSDLQRICRPYPSSFFNTIVGRVPPLSFDYFYHDLLWLILHGHIDPSCVTEHYYVQQQYTVKPSILPSPAPVGTFASSATDQERQHFEHLLAEAVRKASFIPSDLEHEVLRRFHCGDQDAALVIFLPMCNRLKMLEPPVEMKLCTSMFQRVAQDYQRRGIDAEKARLTAREIARTERNGQRPQQCRPSKLPDALPFSEVLVLHVHAHQHGYSFPLPGVLPFMGLPSLQRIIICGARDKTFRAWPDGVTKPSCPEIYFQESSVSEQALTAFAKSCTAPCEMRHWYERPRPDVSSSEPGDPNWDRVFITRRADGSMNVQVSLDFGVGNPGYEHAWVS